MQSDSRRSRRASTSASRPTPRPPSPAGAVRRAAVEALEQRRLFSFSAAVAYAAGDDPQAVAVADFNGDGRRDLAVLNFAGGTVSVLRGNGDGTFQAAVNFATGAGPRSLAVGDFNNDGKPDLASANGSGVGVLLNNGAGGFGAPVSVSMESPLSVAVGDVNADGKLDLVATSSNYFPPYAGYWGYYPGYHYSSATVLLGNGTGAFTPGAGVGLGYGAFGALTAADFNGDGRTDFASASPDNYSVNVLLGTSTGTLAAPTYFTGGYSRSVTAGDVNGDGKADLVTTSASSDTVNVLLGTGTGSFNPAQGYATGASPTAAAIADFNGDGKADLVTANAGAATVSVLLGTGAGAFQAPIHVANRSASASVAVGDFNGDGRPDAATPDGAADAASVLLNDGLWTAVNAPKITISDVTVTEGNTGTVGARFTVSLSAAYTLPVTVKYATGDGSAAVAAGDYQAAAGTLTFTPGETSKTITVMVNGDRLAEEAESFFVRLTDPTSAFLADGIGAGTITDDEPRVAIEWPDGGVSEGNTGTRPLDFTVRLSSASDVPVSVNYSTAEGDTEWSPWGYYGGYHESPPAATSGVDFQARAGTLTFAPGETVKTIAVPVIGDRTPEAHEALSVDLSGVAGGGAVIAARHAVGVIYDDEPYVSVAGGSVMEGNSGSANVTFTATLSAASDVDVTMTYATSDGSATVAGGDYQAKTGTVTFAPGVTTQTFTVAVYGDRLGENTEDFAVNVTGVTNAHPPYGGANGFITDNEAKISVSDTRLTEGNSGTRSMTFTVRLAASYDQTVTVKFATADGSATVADGDYVARSGSLTFAPGEVSKTVTVTIRGDKRKEWDESFGLVLSGASSNAFIATGTGWGVILNDDRWGGDAKTGSRRR